MAEPRLAAALGFASLDLAENRRGQLSAAQRRRLATESRFNRGVSWIMGAGMVGLYAFGIGVALVFSESCRQELARIHAEPDVAIKFWVAMGGILALVLGATWYSSARWRSLGERPLPVLSITGQAIRRRVEGEDGPYYSVQIGELKFDLMQAAYEAFEEGRHYRAYYVLFWRLRLLAAEPL